MRSTGGHTVPGLKLPHCASSQCRFHILAPRRRSFIFGIRNGQGPVANFSFLWVRLSRSPISGDFTQPSTYSGAEEKSRRIILCTICNLS